MYFTVAVITLPAILFVQVILMILSVQAILWITLLCSEVKILSILTAIFQAIGQAITYLLPVSESGHSAIFHDFAGRYSNTCSELTGLVHIGLAIGIIIAFYKVFIKLIFEFFSGWSELFKKQLSLSQTSNSRKFMYLTIIPYVLLPLYFIPIGDKGNIYSLLNSVSYDGNVLSEGICFIITAALLLITSFKLAKNEKGHPLGLPAALLVSIVLFITIPVAGFSVPAVAICLPVLFGVNKKVAFRYFTALSAPFLIIFGIAEIIRCVTYVTIIEGVIAVVLAGAAAYLCSKILLFTVSKNHLKYFSFYNFAIGGIAVIAGVIELIINRG